LPRGPSGKFRAESAALRVFLIFFLSGVVGNIGVVGWS
jgi:hypothetical protein